jgi:two-component system, OmpR family, phosphate regulon sensor histidine kinase PhoR
MKRTLSSILPPVLALIGLALSCFILWRQTAHFRDSVETIAEDVRVSLIDMTGRVVYDTIGTDLPSHADRAEVEAVLRDGHARTILRESETLHVATLYHARRVGDYIVRISVPYQAVTDARDFACWGLVAAGGSGACIILMLILLARRNEERIARIAAERDAKEKLLSEMRKLENFRRDFVSNVTHEIKTPITGILGAVDLLSDDSSAALSPSDRAEILSVLQSQSKRLNALAEDILSLAKLEQSETLPQKDFTLCDVAEIVNTAADLAQSAAQKADVKLTTEIAAPGSFLRECNPRLIEEAITNLINNALRYSGSPTVKVTLNSREDGKLQIRVIDHGIGIPKAAQSRVFERFYRVDKGRSRELGGTGLGLAIVKHIVLLHGGDVSLESEPGSGCTFTLTI